MKRVKIPVNKSFSGSEYRAMGHALYYVLNYKGGDKSETYSYMAAPKAMSNLKSLCSDWLNAVDAGVSDPDVTMSLPTEVQEAIAAFVAATKPKKIKKAKLKTSTVADEIPF